MTASVSIDRTSLSLSALSITDVPNATYLLAKDGLGKPGILWRRTYAPDSADIHGSVLVAISKEEANLPLKVIVQSDTSANLDTAVSALCAALSQFSYPVTVTIDGVAKTWYASPADWSFGDGFSVDAMVLQHVELMSFTIPVYPVPA